MTFDVSVALIWVPFLALFPMALFSQRRAWRILVRCDVGEVALERGEAPSDPRRWAPCAMLINGVAGTVVVVIVSVVAMAPPDETWTAIAGTTIWCKYLLDFARSRRAHGFAARKKA